MPKRPEFDPSLDYRLRTPFKRIGGIIYRKGEIVDLSRVQTRVAERMYNLRHIDPVDPEEAFAAPVQPVSVDPTDADIKALADSNTKPQLLAMADGLGLTDRQTKAEIAEALLRAGRGAA